MFSARMTTALALSAALALPVAAEPLSPVQTAALSARLYDAGVQAGDPILILAAARLRKAIDPVATADRVAEGATPAEDTPLTWQAMLETAEALSEGDEVMAGLYDDLRAETTKGVITGPVYNIGQIPGGGRDVYRSVDFKGGEYAEVYIEARSSVDLNLTITDAQGRLVCADTDISHIAYCGWRPDAPGAFTLTVENKGNAQTRYALMTN